MAKRGSKDDATAPGVGHNAGDREAAIKAALEDMYRIDGEIQDIIEEEVKSLREEKSTIKTSLRERFSLTSKMIQARYYSYKIEREAEAANDTVTLAAIRELYRVLPIGGMVDLVDAAQQAAAKEDKRTDAQKAHDEGRAAAVAGKGLDACPYTKRIERRLKAEWEQGHESVTTERLPPSKQPAAVH
jgi:ribosome modulation factor